MPERAAGNITLVRTLGRISWRTAAELFELQSFQGAAELSTKSFDGQLMIGPLRQAGNRHGTNAPRTYHAKGKTAAVAGLVGECQPVTVKQVRVFLFQLSSDGIGAAVKARHNIALAANPFDIIGRRPG